VNILGIGAFEILVIFLVAFLILGPEKMSEFSKKFAKFVKKIREEKDELTSIIDESTQNIKDEINLKESLSTDEKNNKEGQDN
tara:strand:+ start:211 stop:459 length:249 start_codon:yes stop_codon:yes gene_type:complete